MAAYNPATRPERIESLISGVDRYNPNNLTYLHEYIEAQLRGENDWDCMAALAVLKLYQFNAPTFSYPTVLSILAKSLHALPSPDFNLCLCLLGEAPVSILPQKPTSEETQAANGDEASTSAAAAAATTTPQQPQQPSAGILTDPTILKLQHLATLLASSRYSVFWTTYRSDEYEDVRREVLDDITDFEGGVRTVVLNGTAGAFKSISTDRLARYLGLESSEVSGYLSERANGWSFRAGSNEKIVDVPVNKDNIVKTGSTTKEEVSLNDLSRLLQQAAPSVPSVGTVKA